MLILLFLLVINFELTSYGQDIVKNSSFENYSDCLNKVDNLKSCKNVDKVLEENSPDYFNSCNYKSGVKQTVGVPKNIFGIENAHSGNGYVGIAVELLSNSSKYREFIVMELNRPLKSGSKYRISCYVSLADYSNFFVNAFSFGFLHDKKLLSNKSKDNLLVHCNGCSLFSNSKELKNKDGWTKITGEYLSKGNETYLLIGFFKNTFSMSDIKSALNNRIGENLPYAEFDHAYYYLDDVEIIEVVE